MVSLLSTRPFQGLFACALVLGVLSGCSRPAPESEPVRAVKLLEVGVQALHTDIEYAGEVRAQTESQLGFQVAGKLLRRTVNAGDVVLQGQLLAELDSQDYVLAAQAAQAQVAAALTQRNLAQADWQRFSALKDQGFISSVELDRRRANLQAAQAQLEQAQAQARSQSNQSAYTRLLAAADGVITSVRTEPGQVVAAGSPVVVLAHAGVRDVWIAVPEGAVQAIRPGQKVQVRTWAQTGTRDGLVREVGVSADPVTRTYTVKVAVQGQPQPALGATAYVRVSQAPAEQQAGIKLPSTAVKQQGGQTVVWEFRPETSTVHARTVQIARVEGNEVVVASGVDHGMQLVAVGTHVLSEGQKVSIYQPRHPEAAQ
ncbi:efflux RND transporter periplasmic adaptor subunit [Comamonas sp.]